MNGPELKPCPLCGGSVIGKKSKKGHAFFGCSNYPACSFMTWDKPLEQRCPKCGKTLFRTRGGKVHCLAADCGYEAPAKGKKDDE